MFNITRKLNAISETVATDLLFKGFREAMGEGVVTVDLVKGPDTFRFDIVSEDPLTNQDGQKYWELALYCEGHLVASAFADEHDL
jgi:hypothetical protein